MIMSSTRSSDQESLEMNVKQGGSFFSRKLSKENARDNSSSRVYYYYGGASVPFVWETRPGTPKHTLFSDSSHPNPPLTPPPSYYCSNDTPLQNKTAFAKSSKRNSFLLATLLHIMDYKKKNDHVSPSSSSWSSTSSSLSSFSSSCSSSSSLKKVTCKKKYYLTCSRSPLPYVNDEDDETQEDVELGSPNSTLCFRDKPRGTKRASGWRRRCSMEKVKKAFISVIR